jgi:hypothetical protein
MQKSSYPVFLFSCLLILFQCNSKKTEDKTEAVRLSDQQIADGWKLLFDGKTLNGWRFFKNRENDSWEVIDGTLHCKPFDLASRRSDILTVEQYDNFELAFEWKISAQGNSGVMFRITEEFSEPYFSGPEYQIMDDVGYPGESKEVHHTGANYDIHAPVNASVKPVGEWNATRLIVNGNHVEHWLNGVPVVTYELQSPEWLAVKNASKWNDAPGYGAAPKGHIAFQDHGNEVWFRNILIKPLP